MKRFVALLLVVAFLFGFGFTLSQVTYTGPAVVADGPGIPPPIPPTQWPPGDCNSITPPPV